MNIVAVLGIGIIGALLAVTVRTARPELGMCVAAIAGCIIFSSILPQVSEVIEEIKSLSETAGVDFSYFNPLVKVIGIAYITQFSSEVIKDSGEGAIAKKVEFAGKIAVMILILPILKTLIEAVVGAVNLL